MIERTPDTPRADSTTGTGQRTAPADVDVSGVASVSAPPVTAREAAEVAGVSERTIRRAIGRGELPAGKHAGAYRIAPTDLATWQRGHAPDTGQPSQRTVDTRPPADRTGPDSARRTDRQPPADRPARADTGHAGGAGPDLAPLAEVIAQQGAELARLAAAAAMWQERARVLEDRLLALGAGDTGQDAPSAAPAPPQATETVEPAPATPSWWGRLWRRLSTP